MQEELPRKLLVAIGGNAIHPADPRATSAAQTAIAAAAAQALLPLMLGCPQLVVTHGNGPVVGKSLLRQFHACDIVPPLPLDMCVAESEGSIGYLLTQAMENALAAAGSTRSVACLLTEVEVDAQDEAFAAPSKPVGPFFSADKARDLAADGWTMMEDSGRGWRLAVPSPAPLAIVGLPVIAQAFAAGSVVIAAGGGGIPVLRDAEGRRRGVQAVVDKDLASALLARALDIEQMLILTAVPKIAIHYRQPGEVWLDVAAVADMRRYLAAGHFGIGSMAPKVEAALRFLEAGGRRVIVAHLNEAQAALRGETGTHILP